MQSVKVSAQSGIVMFACEDGENKRDRRSAPANINRPERTNGLARPSTPGVLHHRSFERLDWGSGATWKTGGDLGTAAADVTRARKTIKRGIGPTCGVAIR